MNATTDTTTREVYSLPLTQDQQSNLLKATDRCDRCGGPAYFIATKNNLPLLFCRHDFMKNEADLVLQGFSIVDQSFLLMENVNPLQNTKDYR